MDECKLKSLMHPGLAEKLGWFLTAEGAENAKCMERVTGEQVKAGYRSQGTGDRDQKPNLQTTKGNKGDV